MVSITPWTGRTNGSQRPLLGQYWGTFYKSILKSCPRCYSGVWHGIPNILVIFGTWNVCKDIKQNTAIRWIERNERHPTKCVSSPSGTPMIEGNKEDILNFPMVKVFWQRNNMSRAVWRVVKIAIQDSNFATRTIYLSGKYVSCIMTNEIFEHTEDRSLAWYEKTEVVKI